MCIRDRLNTAKPKADYYDAFINPDDCTNIRTTAKDLKIPERKFVQFLLREKYLFRSPSGQLLPYNKDSNAGPVSYTHLVGLAVGNGGFYVKTSHPKPHYRPLSEIVPRG